MVETCLRLRAETRRNGYVFPYMRNHDDDFVIKPFIQLGFSYLGKCVFLWVKKRSLLIRDAGGQLLWALGINGAPNESEIKLRLETQENGNVTIYIRNPGRDFSTNPFFPLELDFCGKPVVLRVKGEKLIFYVVENQLKARLFELDITREP